jgi:hypothetical protein
MIPGIQFYFAKEMAIVNSTLRADAIVESVATKDAFWLE